MHSQLKSQRNALTSNEELKAQSLDDESNQIVEEARMVLPGIQALFGFQLIAVFNEGFDNALSSAEQLVHLTAIVFVVLAIAIIMAPAAYHRQAERGLVSRYFADFSSWLVTIAMLPLMMGIVLEVFLVARVIVHDVLVSLILAACLTAVFVCLWFVFPRVMKRRRPRARKA